MPLLLKAFRAVSIIEGLSYLYLLYCSLYLKRILGDEHAIDTPGMIHGVLFLLFCLFLGLSWMKEKVSLSFSILAFIASLIPFGFIWIDLRLKKEVVRLDDPQG